VAVMVAVIGQLKSTIKIPFGVDVLWNPIAAVSVAKATGASFVREVFTNIYVGDFGLWRTDMGSTTRFQRTIEATDLDFLFNINAEFASALDSRDITQIAQSVVFSSLAEILCVSGPVTGKSAELSNLKIVKEVVQDVYVLANTGVKLENVTDILSIANGVVVGTSLKKDGVTWNQVDSNRVKLFMEVVKKVRKVQS